MDVKIPGLDIPFAVLFVGIALINIGFRFLSLAVGFNVGSVSDVSDFGMPRTSKDMHIAARREHDVR